MKLCIFNILIKTFYWKMLYWKVADFEMCHFSIKEVICILYICMYRIYYTHAGLVCNFRQFVRKSRERAKFIREGTSGETLVSKSRIEKGLVLEHRFCGLKHLAREKFFCRQGKGEQAKSSCIIAEGLEPGFCLRIECNLALPNLLIPRPVPPVTRQGKGGTILPWRRRCGVSRRRIFYTPSSVICVRRPDNAPSLTSTIFGAGNRRLAQTRRDFASGRALARPCSNLLFQTRLALGTYMYGEGKKGRNALKLNCAAMRAIRRLKENHDDADVINDVRGFRVNAHLSCAGDTFLSWQR